MMNQYTRCEDFVADSYFRQWVKHPDEASTLYWHTYLDEHPDQADTIQQAIELVNNLSDAAATLAAAEPDDSENHIWTAIREQLNTTREEPVNPFTAVFRQHWRNWFAVAASLTILLGAGWWWLHAHRSNDAQRHYRQIARVHPSLVEERNDTEKPRLIPLPDGSSIILRKGSQVTYSRKFNGPTRTVQLVGEAYFEVAKDPSRPFLVHANGLLTKVLGTSFTVRAYAEDKDVVVTVRSGRVAVFSQTDKAQRQKAASSSLAGIILTRNQQLVFARQQARFLRTSQVAATTPIFPKGLATSASNFVFTATPVSTIFAELEKVYGVKIQYDKNILGNCRLTADLTDESLSEKMTIICKSIEADYQMQQLTIVVSGTGCQP